MRNLMLLLFTVSIISCNNSGNNLESVSSNKEEIDILKELESIEETRAGFELAIKEKRYADLKNYATEDLISLTPICGEWEEFKRLRNNPNELFSYDSLIMRPEETVIVSDSVAYDFGTSSVYYTNDVGKPVEISDTFLAILKKEKKDGRWKLHREVATTNKRK
jgi:ketosteroid isomerase-like protein